MCVLIRKNKTEQSRENKMKRKKAPFSHAGMHQK
jgi:hypothetical protein